MRRASEGRSCSVGDIVKGDVEGKTCARRRGGGNNLCWIGQPLTGWFL